MNIEKKYGRYPDGLADLEEPPEEWQFENPIVSAKVGGEVKVKDIFTRPKPAPPKYKPISEFLKTIDREANKVEFIKLDMDKQVKMVAEAYNEGLGVSEAQRKLGIRSPGTYYNRLKSAKEMGLVLTEAPAKETQAEVVPVKEKQAPLVPEEEAQTPLVIKADFDAAIREARGRVEILEQANMIAKALNELLGESGNDLVNEIFRRVS